METETIDKLFLELSQITSAQTQTESRQDALLVRIIYMHEQFVNAPNLVAKESAAKSLNIAIGKAKQQMAAGFKRRLTRRREGE